ncbi:hypothetical protein [uncultured Aquimarina sp.]|uniref:hypothetical protein n=1 Tax=uncultured Aquimarina sp. TaxID=575652 RepID=UPI002639EDBB|nr:hypothetical protein [uncultured Aquimarina sp.]
MKSILEFKGVKVLNKQQQQTVKGGNGSDVCAAASTSGSSLLGGLVAWVFCRDNNE